MNKKIVKTIILIAVSLVVLYILSNYNLFNFNELAGFFNILEEIEGENAFWLREDRLGYVILGVFFLINLIAIIILNTGNKDQKDIKIVQFLAEFILSSLIFAIAFSLAELVPMDSFFSILFVIAAYIYGIPFIISIWGVFILGIIPLFATAILSWGICVIIWGLDQGMVYFFSKGPQVMFSVLIFSSGYIADKCFEKIVEKSRSKRKNAHLT